MDSAPYVLITPYALGVPVAPKQSGKIKKSTEFERLTRWRFEALLALGLAPDQAIALIETPDIVHSAQELADRGCPPKFIANLLGE